jgi:beta-lactam-binding protein with PASTA domain
VVIILRLPEGAQETGRLTVEAGGRASLTALIRNQSGIVDNYDLEVVGLPDEWWTVAPPTVYLVPFGAPGGSYEGEVEIQIHPPRTAQAEARAWPIEVVARSKAEAGASGSAATTVVITPFTDLESRLRPEVVAGRRKGTFGIEVNNRSNAPIDVAVTAVDSENACRFDFEHPELTAAPGRRAGTVFTVHPRKHIWIGRTTDRRFDVAVRVVGSDAAGPRSQAVFRQKPWIPKWSLAVPPVIVGAVVLALTLLPNNTTVPALKGMLLSKAEAVIQNAHLKLAAKPTLPDPAPAGARIVDQDIKAGSTVKSGSTVTVTILEPVPNLKGKIQSTAGQLLQAAGLASQPQVEQIVSSATPGTIIDTDPPAGTMVRLGSLITVKVAVGTTTRTVPNVVGSSLADAQATLTKAGLTCECPQPPPGLTFTTAFVNSQLERPGATVRVGSLVAVTVRPKVTPKGPTVPAVAGLTATAAAAALAAQGVTPQTVWQLSETTPANTAIGTSLPPKSKLTPGSTVQLFVSAGFPKVVFSDGTALKVMSGVPGGTVQPLTTPPAGQMDIEPTWRPQPSSTLVAYRRQSSNTSGKIWVVDEAKGPSSAYPLTPGPDDRRPAFSPDGKVVAFIHDSGSGTVQQLCFRAFPYGTASCVSGTTTVDRPTWSPDGKAILVVAVSATVSTQYDLVEYASTQPDSANASDWTSQGVVANQLGGQPSEGVQFAAWAPNGKQVAIVANWNHPSVNSVFLSPVASGVLGTPVDNPPISGCEVAWRPDSQELLVSQGQGGCANPSGEIVRVDTTVGASTSGTQKPLLTAGGQNAAWQYLPVTGG